MATHSPKLTLHCPHTLTFISLGLTIRGLIKRNQKAWIGSLAAFVVLTLVTVFSIITYAKKTIDYMGSDEFQAETKKKAENTGRIWGNTVSGAAQGLEATLDDEAIEKLAKKGAVIAGKGVKAVATGLDETTGKTTVFADKPLADLGVSIGRAEQLTDSTNNSFGLFLEFKKDFAGKLALTAYDSKGLKMDNAELNVKAEGGTAKVHVFRFKYFKPGLSGYCILTKAE
ncbi:hypothetical protein IC235_21135 [Hymenobacter sp. BT664]|uniref:Uncharacterized protein n=1 Tax=Hymenobacter montanus TaxID=2771359 RepID=A0A927BI97_9BACT|nr:hypothetical protein [Hymenobacter montanus]MBD2770398.1 hypothetical protein [Hymenobacter montanus]